MNLEDSQLLKEFLLRNETLLIGELFNELELVTVEEATEFINNNIIEDILIYDDEINLIINGGRAIAVIKAEEVDLEYLEAIQRELIWKC